MEKSLVIMLFLCSLSAQAQAQYRITRAKLAGWGMLAVAGAADGAVEGFEFENRTSFQRKRNVNPYGFWGQKSHLNAYVDRNPDLGFKSNFVREFGVVDFYHVMDDVRKYGYISGGAVIVLGSKQKAVHTALDIGIGFAVSALTKRAAMKWIRS